MYLSFFTQKIEYNKYHIINVVNVILIQDLKKKKNIHVCNMKLIFFIKL